MRHSVHMQCVLAVTGAFYGFLDDRLNVSELLKFPRDIEQLILYGLEVPIVRRPNLTLYRASQYLCVLRGESPKERDNIPDREVGFDHGVGHPLLLLCHAKAHNYRKNKALKDIICYSEWPKVADAVIKADMSAGGCHKDDEPGHREVPEETRTSPPCPVTACLPDRMPRWVSHDGDVPDLWLTMHFIQSISSSWKYASRNHARMPHCLQWGGM